jgi:serine/threonine protein kinase
MTVECPSDQILCRYALGDLDDAQADQIDRHLSVCDSCETSLARFDSTADSLMRHLPLAAAEPPEANAEPPGWLARLRNGPPREPKTTSPSTPDGDADLGVATGLPVALSAYELLGVLGRGGMGIVYRARHRQLNRQVALKVLSPRVMATAEARRRFEREIRILGGLHHPGIVMATDANRIDGVAYLVMELIDGVDLARMVRQHGPLKIGEACEAGRQMADALAVAHQAGTIHRDIKPSNVMVDRHGRVKLLDFGLAQLALLSTESLETSLGRLLGTLDYMAPEQADGEMPLDLRADLFGLGATLFFLLTGRPPRGDHSRGTLLRQLKALTGDPPPRVSSLRADVPAELDDYIARLLARDPESRPASAASVAQTLSAWAGGDLAALVKELPSPLTANADSSDEVELAKRSLSELLGTATVVSSADSDQKQAPSSQVARPPRGPGSKLAGLLALGGVAAAALFAVIILLRTPEGTLKIESEVDGVQVELVDAQDRTQELTIRQGPNESTLRTGQYWVRLAGAHDGITIDHDVITLQRGAQTVARITREPLSAKQASLQGVVKEADQPLYQGKTQADWERLFAAETSPIGKLEAAQALLAMADHLPPQRKIEKLLNVGKEIVRASFGDEVIAFALANGSAPPYQAPRWPLNGAEKDLYQAYFKFQRHLNDSVRTIPAEALSDGLSRSLRDEPGARGAFAASLLRGAASQVIDGNHEASQVVLRELNVPLTGIDWSALYLIVRSHFLKQATPEQREQIVASVIKLGGLLRDRPANGTAHLMGVDLLDVFSQPTLGNLQTALRRTLAGLVLDGNVTMPGFAQNLPGDPSLQPGPLFGAESVAGFRANKQFFLDQWLSVANAYLEKHPTPPNGGEVRWVIGPVGWVLNSYSDGDDWPVEKTAALLTEQLRGYYTDDPKTTIDVKSLYDLVPAEPATLLTEIVPITGAIPDFVRKGHPKLASVAAKLKRFEAALNAGQPSPRELMQLMQGGQTEFAGLMGQAPYEVIKLAVGQRPADASVSDRKADLWKPWHVLQATSAQQGELWNNNRKTDPIDPRLLLTALADLTGQNQTQDNRIAGLLSNPNMKDAFRVPMENLLDGPLKARGTARRLLQKMAATAKSPKLVKVIGDLDPTLVPPKP